MVIRILIIIALLLAGLVVGTAYYEHVFHPTPTVTRDTQKYGTGLKIDLPEEIKQCDNCLLRGEIRDGTLFLTFE